MIVLMVSFFHSRISKSYNFKQFLILSSSILKPTVLFKKLEQLFFSPAQEYVKLHVPDFSLR